MPPSHPLPGSVSRPRTFSPVITSSRAASLCQPSEQDTYFVPSLSVLSLVPQPSRSFSSSSLMELPKCDSSSCFFQPSCFLCQGGREIRVRGNVCKPTDCDQTFISVSSSSSWSHLSKKPLVLINLPEVSVLRGVHVSGSGCTALTVALGLLLPATGFQSVRLLQEGPEAGGQSLEGGREAEGPGCRRGCPLPSATACAHRDAGCRPGRRTWHSVRGRAVQTPQPTLRS